MSMYDGFFELEIKAEGVFLILHPAKNEGKSINFNQVIEYLDSKGFTDYDKKAIKDALDNLDTTTEIKISNEKKEAVDEGIEINISPDKIQAFVRFYPSIGDGMKLTNDEIIEALDKKNVLFGIDRMALMQVFQSREPYKDYLIAKGQPVIEGSHAHLAYFFSRNSDAKPKINEDGSVDFHQLNMISNVKKGDILAELTPEYEGQKGMDVHGNEIRPKKVKKMILKYGKNVSLSDDKLKLIADKDGYVRVENEKVVVYDYYEVPADVDSSTGDIEFDGTVIVRGNVRTGYKIKAKGDIEIQGVVEGATLICQGQVILRRGIQGMGKGIIECKGNLITKFIENSTVRVGGYIQSEAILHSNVTAKGEIVVEGKKGMVTGGEVRSGVEIRSKILGSHMGTITNVEVGIDPSVVDEYNEITEEISNIRDEVKKMNQAINLIKNKQRQTGQLSPDRLQILQTSTRNKIFLESKLSTLLKKHEEYAEILDNKNSGKIKVLNVAYPGVRVTIGNVRYFLREESKFCSMYKDGADIKISSYS